MSFVLLCDQGAVPCHLFACFNRLLHRLVQFCKRIIFFSKRYQTLPMRECCLAFCCYIFITIWGYSSPVLPVVRFTLKVGLQNASKPLNCFSQSLCHIPCTFCVSFDTMSSVACRSSVSKWLSCVFTTCLALLQRDTSEANWECLKIHSGAVKSWKNTAKPNLPFSVSSADM